jgi:hypothetical protein
VSKVLGEFPEEDANSLIPEGVIRAAIEREYKPGPNEYRYIGVDVARFGTDKTVFTEFVGWKQTRVETMHMRDTFEVLGPLIEFIKNDDSYGNRPVRVAVDAGYGHGVIDALMLATGQKRINHLNAPYQDLANTLTESVEILEINFGGQDWVKFHYGWKDEAALLDPELAKDRNVQEDRENYTNFKAKMFDLLARDMRTRISLLNHPDYLKDLPSVIIIPAGDSKMKIEAKSDYKKRTGQDSPDACDSLALANFARYFAKRPMGMLEALS